MRKEAWFGLCLMALVLAAIVSLMPAPSAMTNEHLGLLMLALIVICIMLGFPTAFTLMGMGVLFAWLAYRSASPELAVRQTLDLMVQRAYGVMTNDVLISIPLFVFMGYLIERANLVARLFRSLHLSLARIPGSLAVATLATCAIFATATGIVGAVVTLMGLLAFPAMLKAGYGTRLSAGVITAGGCLGILIPPSVLLIVYGATAGVSVVQLYAGAFFPGLMLAGLYIVYTIVIAKLRPDLAPPLSGDERRVPLPDYAQHATGTRRAGALIALLRLWLDGRNTTAPRRVLNRQIAIALIPAITVVGAALLGYRASVAPPPALTAAAPVDLNERRFLDESSPSGLDSLQAPPGEPAAADAAAPRQADEAALAAPRMESPGAADTSKQHAADQPSKWFWISVGIAALLTVAFYLWFDFARLEVFKMLLGSFFPLAALIVAVLGSIVFGFATPTEAAAVGALGGTVLAALYRQLNFTVLKESVFLTARTSAMVCWLFVGASIFSAAFALLGGQALIERWVLSMQLSAFEFMVLSQVIIFLLGWPLEWTEIIVIFMPIFIPLLAHFNIDPLFFGLLVALNLQTAFLSPPVAMAAFYLKGVAPRHVTLNQIFAGMLPFMAIQIVAVVLLYLFPAIGLWLPSVLYD
ncbi:TRAP transporter large permease [Paraburkholderia sp. SOS3]|jgi:TRAP-type mannitol/chloroaromatic compound transport system permease large subunit|uniref:TRAP transporter large permease n=1 Tax=Paraburkholderia sp. SOS3 TaxID=1926494 RepID=UPI0009477083|nr:TRAP transporter large permease subunit [Paraburkholderia sp. SOS3]APR37269.1 C4-dicarboxylate ABC transporter [Paraburkholderia sp. SOS3]